MGDDRLDIRRLDMLAAMHVENELGEFGAAHQPVLAERRQQQRRAPLASRRDWPPAGFGRPARECPAPCRAGTRSRRPVSRLRRACAAAQSFFSALAVRTTVQAAGGAEISEVTAGITDFAPVSTSTARRPPNSGVVLASSSSVSGSAETRVAARVRRTERDRGGRRRAWRRGERALAHHARVGAVDRKQKDVFRRRRDETLGVAVQDGDHQASSLRASGRSAG